MTQKLTIVSYGFFLYAVEDQECSVFAAPALKSGDTKHEITAMVIGPITCSTVPGIKASHDVISPATCTLRFGGKAGAALSDFHLIVNFGALCCGARLKKNWTTDDPKHTDLQVELSRGTLTAYPDAYTNAARWKWQDCNGAHVEQRVTSLTVYEQDSWPGVLEFEARREGGTAGTVEFNGDAIVVLAHKLADAEALAKRVDDAHADATKRLCSPDGDDPIYPRPIVDPATLPQAPLSDDIKGFLGLDYAQPGVPAPAADGVIWFKGRPNCSARVMYL